MLRDDLPASEAAPILFVIALLQVMNVSLTNLSSTCRVAEYSNKKMTTFAPEEQCCQAENLEEAQE